MVRRRHHPPGSNSSHQLIDSRIAAHKPRSLNWAESAALPLTALTAWEALFEHLNIQDAPEHKTLLIIGGAGESARWPFRWPHCAAR